MYVCVCVLVETNIYSHLFFFLQVHNAAAVTADVQLYILYYYSLLQQPELFNKSGRHVRSLLVCFVET